MTQIEYKIEVTDLLQSPEHQIKFLNQHGKDGWIVALMNITGGKTSPLQLEPVPIMVWTFYREVETKIVYGG